MGKSQKFFRYVWRFNAVLILLAAGAVTLGVGGLIYQEFGFKVSRNREAAGGIDVTGPNARVDLVLSRATTVQGTQVMRADLQRFPGVAKFSGGGYSETRNILFIEPGQKTAHWLLPENDHIVEDLSDITDTKEANDRRVVVSSALVKLATDSTGSATGKLLLFDPSGKKIVEVADNVRTIQIASIKEGELVILFERDKRLFLDVFDPQSITKLREEAIEIPLLK